LAAVADKIRTVKNLQALRHTGGNSASSTARTVNKRKHSHLNAVAYNLPLGNLPCPSPFPR